MNSRWRSPSSFPQPWPYQIFLIIKMSSGGNDCLFKNEKRVRSDRLNSEANEICALPNGLGVRGKTPLVLEAIPGMSESKLSEVSNYK